MTTNEQAEKSADSGENQRQRVTTIGRRVLEGLGEPADLHRIDVRLLWADHYRVNVLLGTDVTSLRVQHSYFVVADSQGNIVTATPDITRSY